MSELTRRDVFQAIADPTRRQILELVSKGPMNLKAIAENFNISQPAISQQIKILEECGIVGIETVGRERICSLQTKKLIPAFLWLDKLHIQWEERIDSFEKYVNQLHKKTNKPKKQRK
jgi:DNA-binding transcriptional ArsR family regulator